MLRRTSVPAGIALALSVLASNSGLADDQAGVGSCLGYDPRVVALRGILRRHTFPGPPNYESAQAGDEAETGFYLHLARPVCTFGDEDDYEAYPQQNVSLVQLNFGRVPGGDSVGYARLRPVLGRRVAIVGTLYAAHTGHHHAPLIIWVDVKRSLEATHRR